jgi:hypothetical protein
LLDLFKRAGVCHGFIEGIIDRDTIATTDDKGHALGRTFCVPGETSEGELARVVVKYGNDHPQELPYPAAFIVLFAMQGAFPCR